jgi:hypothetical protein
VKRTSDPFGRERLDIEREAEFGERAVALLDEVLELGRRLRLGREGGGRQLRRLEVSRGVFARVGERDRAIVAELEFRERDEPSWRASAQREGTRLVLR